MEPKLQELLEVLYETRQEVSNLRNNLGISLGDIQVGYEYTIETLLELLGFSEQQINSFWYLTEPGLEVS